MDMYLNKINDKWFALLPNHQYKEIPYINWVKIFEFTMDFSSV